MIVIISFSSVQSSAALLTIVELFCHSIFKQMRSLNCNEKLICEKFGAQTAKNNIVRRKKRCSVGLHYCAKDPIFSTRFQTDLNFLIAKKHRLSELKKSLTSVNLVIKYFQALIPGDYTDRWCTTNKMHRRPKIWLPHS